MQPAALQRVNCAFNLYRPTEPLEEARAPLLPRAQDGRGHQRGGACAFGVVGWGGGESLTRESAMRETEEERGVECAYVSESDRLLCVPCGELHYAVAATN